MQFFARFEVEMSSIQVTFLCSWNQSCRNYKLTWNELFRMVVHGQVKCHKSLAQIIPVFAGTI